MMDEWAQTEDTEVRITLNKSPIISHFHFHDFFLLLLSKFKDISKLIHILYVYQGVYIGISLHKDIWQFSIVPNYQ